MKFYRQPLALIIVAVLLPILSGCSTVQRVDAPRTQMTVKQARKAMTESLNNMYPIKSVREVQFNRKKVTFIADGTKCSVSFAEMENLSVLTGDTIWPQVLSNGKQVIGGLGLVVVSPKYVTAFVDALLILKEAALASNTEDADYAAFTASAKIWLAATPKPEMSDEARAFKALAEDAFKRKDFPAALDAYCDALNKYPMWPSGHYNAALLAAEAEDYELAAQHMHRYLVLTPDAKDAAAAKDKLLLWQLKAKE